MLDTGVLHVTETIPSIRVEFPLAPSLDGHAVSGIEWVQESNKHDLMTIRLVGSDPAAILPFVPGGSPLKVTISTSRGKRTFYGYVHKAEPEYGRVARAVTITAVSVGYPMKEAGKTALSNVTADMAVKKIARKHRLFADVEKHPRKFRQLVQSGETDWEFLCRIAEEVGYALRIEGVTLRFVSRSALSRHYRSLAPTLRYVKNRGAFIYDVLHFRPIQGAYLDEASPVRAKRRVDYLDKYAKKFAKANSGKPLDVGRKGTDPQYTRFDRRTAKTFKEASLIAQARMENSRYAVVAEAEIVGNPLIAPDVAVYLKGAPKRFQGYWTVIKAVHHIEPAQYTVDMVLGSEGTGTDRHGNPKGPGSRHKSRYRLRTPYPVPTLSKSGVRSGRQGVQIPDFFDKGPRWVSRKR